MTKVIKYAFLGKQLIFSFEQRKLRRDQRLSFFCHSCTECTGSYPDSLPSAVAAEGCTSAGPHNPGSSGLPSSVVAGIAAADPLCYHTAVVVVGSSWKSRIVVEIGIPKSPRGCTVVVPYSTHTLMPIPTTRTPFLAEQESGAEQAERLRSCQRTAY